MCAQLLRRVNMHITYRSFSGSPNLSAPASIKLSSLSQATLQNIIAVSKHGDVKVYQGSHQAHFLLSMLKSVLVQPTIYNVI